MINIEIDEQTKIMNIKFTKKIYPIKALIETANILQNFCDASFAETDDLIQVTLEPKIDSIPLVTLGNEFCNHALNQSKELYEHNR
ncbi:MAG: HxsD-like protein [Candidatus Diapherotrites archaeon]|nr:HxsD-like protein [Candidatus Diapherotrites archaeon]